MHALTRLFQTSLVRFALTGVLNTLVGLGSIFGLKALAHMGDTPANLIGYLVGLCVSYLVNARWSFGYRRPLLPVLPRYLSVIAAAYLANLGCVHFGIQALHLNSYLAQTCGVLPYTALSYVGLRWFVFPKEAAPVPAGDAVVDAD